MSLVLVSFTLIYRAACPLLVKHSTINLSLSLAHATPVWKNRGLVTALHTTSSDGMQLADMVGRAAVAQLTQV